MSLVASVDISPRTEIEEREHGLGLAGRLPHLKYIRERKFSLQLYLFVYSPVPEEQGVIKCEQPLRKQAANPYFLAENPLFRRNPLPNDTDYRLA